MSVITDVITRLRSNRQEQSKTTWQQYHAIVVALANDEQCDVDALAIVLDALDKSDSDLANDIDVQRKRTAAAGAIASGATAQSDAVQAEQDVAKMEWQLLSLQRELGPKIDLCRQKIAQCESQLFQSRYAQDYLRSNVLDPSVSQREQQLSNEHNALAHRAGELRRKIKSCNIDYRRSHLQQLERSQSLAAFFSPRVDADLQNARQTLAAAQNQVEPWANELQQIDRRLSEIASELQRLDSEKLKP